MDNTANQKSIAVPRPKLLRRPAQGDGEGFQAYLTRLSEANRLQGAECLARILGLEYGELVMYGPSALQALLGREVAATSDELPTHRHIRARKKNRLGMYLRTRVCPLCLKEGRHPPACWDWPMSISCSIHGILLIDQCPACGNRISHLRHHRNICRCGLDWRTCTPEVNPTWLSQLYSVFAPWHAGIAAIPNDRADSDHDAFRILRGYLLLLRRNAQPQGRIYRGLGVDRLERSLFDEIAELLNGWPSEFSINIRAISKTASNCLSDLIEVGEKIGLTALNLVVDAAMGGWRRLPRRASGSIVGDNEEPIWCVRQIAILLGVSDHSVIKSIESGAIKAHLYPQEAVQRRRRVAVSDEQTRQLRELARTTVKLELAALYLGIPAIHLNLLARADMVPSVRFSRESSGWRFRTDDIDRLIERLWSMAVDSPNNNEKLRRLKDLEPARVSASPTRAWIQMAKRMASGEIPIYRIANQAPCFAALAIEVIDVPCAGNWQRLKVRGREPVSSKRRFSP